MNTEYKIFEQIFSGAKNHRGVLGYHNATTEEKKAWEEKQTFDWEEHLNGKRIQGRSPVDETTRMVEWIVFDIDIKYSPEKFCRKIWTELGTSFFPIGTINKKWRLFKWLDEPTDVREANRIAKEIEEDIVKRLKIEVDTGHTLPTIPDEDKPGSWIFFPFHNKDTVCYSPKGEPLTKEQFIFRWKHRNCPPIVASVGMNTGGRRKALWVIKLFSKVFDYPVDLDEVQSHFKFPLKSGSKAIKHHEYKREIKHLEKTVEQEKHNKEYYLKGEPKWLKEICGVEPFRDAQGFSALSTAVSDNYIYVRDRVAFFEKDSFKFVEKEQMNDWFAHEVKAERGQPNTMSAILLKNKNQGKVQSYFTHAGLEPGLIEIKRGDVPGKDPGQYLNIYRPSLIISKKGDVQKYNEYYTKVLGEEKWHTQKQVLSFMLNEPGKKIQWFNIWHSQTQGVGKGLFALACQSLFGPSNVKINVKFKQMVGSHSTIIEGAQIIFLNEVVLEKSTAQTKTLTEEFKNLITEPNLIINPKFKNEIEVPNLCNFFVFSNSETPLYIDDEDRRAYVINVKHEKQTIKHWLENEGYKKEILKVISDPSALKYHLMNEIQYDSEMFYQDAPLTDDKTELISANRNDLESLLDEAHSSESFPFGHINLFNPHKQEVENLQWYYNGMINIEDLFKALNKHPDYNKVFKSVSILTKYIKSKSTKWGNGEYTRQIIKPDGKKKRVYQTHPYEHDGKYLVDMTEGELGKLYTGTINFREVSPVDTNKVLQTEDYQTVCWSCRKEIELTNETKCPECNWAIRCDCGVCACDKPGSKIKKINQSNY
jgi:hypothetical protein